MTIWYILYSFGTFSGLGIMYQEKSGNPAIGAGLIGVVTRMLVNYSFFRTLPFSGADL
jgi:hypothetical protein